ncbi:serine protease [Bacillus paralicheniformis]|uniref:S8 family peptidase n=1 Tax=Bacillus TaxID=1386 RepID=UPI000952A9CF|nr:MULTISPECIES: S8 family peptidase [Bacillus subtilis group]MSN98226.1 S8 family serine peptidase [Bacillus paralicheniformis]MSO02234.1 S8 family serine peptidase [Bacillus paralicheniformis]MSO06227.1 S8 family serine peptidase [Bacillus paralicheniformis]MSO10221.1 S8 family serine peptidase [Bacillus paralicheniformis]NJE38863.1 serine protease [Bacillus paralicheniformis]
MFGSYMVQMVRSNAHKLDRPLRESVLKLYKPFKWTPCFLHGFFEKILMKNKKIPVIIEFEKDCQHKGYQLVNEMIGSKRRNKIKHRFSNVSCCSAEVTPSSLQSLLSECGDIRKIYLNRKVKALLDVALESSHAKEVIRNNQTLTGKGVTVAVIDTGVYPHEDLEGRIRSFQDFINQRTEPYDDNGHGTHCAGDACGNGAASSGQYRGPAPEAELVGVKVLDKMGSGSLETVIQGVDWCIQFNKENPDDPIDIISMSLGAEALRYENEEEDPVVKAVHAAWDAGIVVCAAAGNSGPDAQTIASPGVSSKIITVGALDDRDTVSREDDDVASYSSRGPTIYGQVKPDLLVPGTKITSLRSPGSFLDKLQKTNRVGTKYMTLSGTSMATPICAGIAALILQQAPGTEPDEVKQLLMDGTDLWKDRDPNVYGAGYINAEQSVPQD